LSSAGNSFSIYESRGSGPARLHLHHSDDEAWHVLDGELTFRYADREETVGSGTTVGPLVCYGRTANICLLNCAAPWTFGCPAEAR
jgi:uncharacterized cupin superfamily protein